MDIDPNIVPVLTVVASIIAPFLTSLVKRIEWTDQTKVAVANLISLILAIGISVYQGKLVTLELESIIANWGIISALSTIIFNTIFKPYGFEDRIQTTFRKERVVEDPGTLDE